MKRIVFAAVLLAAVIVFNFFCLFTIAKIRNESVQKLDLLYSYVRYDDREKTAFECEKFTEYWFSEHRILSQMVRHDFLDQITVAVSGFVPLAEFDETAELASEINRCKILIEEMWDSERPILRNIL